jgi:hypothetical protein
MMYLKISKQSHKSKTEVIKNSIGDLTIPFPKADEK